jgi:hypothetical protein
MTTELKFVGLPKETTDNPVLARRAAIIQRLEEQLKLANDPNFLRTVRHYVTNPDSTKSLQETKQKIRPYWRPTPSGEGFVLSIKLGRGKFVTFDDKGHQAIAFKSPDELPGVLQALIELFRSGKLDHQLTSQGVPIRTKPKDSKDEKLSSKKAA